MNEMGKPKWCKKNLFEYFVGAESVGSYGTMEVLEDILSLLCVILYFVDFHTVASFPQKDGQYFTSYGEDYDEYSNEYPNYDGPPNFDENICSLPIELGLNGNEMLLDYWAKLYKEATNVMLI